MRHKLLKIFRIVVYAAAILSVSGTTIAQEAADQSTSTRRAFVVGIDEYRNVLSLDRPVNDARAISSTLSELGFSVELVENPDRRTLTRRFLEFRSEVASRDVVLFFFAGHGVTIGGGNYLLASDVPDLGFMNADLVASEGLGVHEIMGWIQARDPRISILIIDACRDAPFSKAGTRGVWDASGLSRIEAANGTFILYSAGFGQAAVDGLGDQDDHPNSVFTRVLTSKLTEPRLELRRLAQEVRREVYALTRSEMGYDQRPAYQDELLGDFYFAPERRHASLATPSDAEELAAGVSKESDQGFMPDEQPEPSTPGLVRVTVRTVAAEELVGPATSLKEAHSSGSREAGRADPNLSRLLSPPDDHTMQRVGIKPDRDASAPSPAKEQVRSLQKAIFYEERTSSSEGTAQEGSVAWSLIEEPPADDLPPEPVVEGEATIPGKDIWLKLAIRRNADETLPASHIIELIILTPDDFEGGGIENVLRIAMKESEQATGNPLLGIPAKIADGFFLVALSDTKAAMETNVTMLRRLRWIDISVAYESGRRALMAMEMGEAGDAVFGAALDEWARLDRSPKSDQKPRDSLALRSKSQPSPQLTEAATNAEVSEIGTGTRTMNSPWSVQIASKPTIEDAKKAYADMARRYTSVLSGREVNIVRAEIEGMGVHYRVRVPAASREEAIKVCERLQKAGGSCLVFR